MITNIGCLVVDGVLISIDHSILSEFVDEPYSSWELELMTTCLEHLFAVCIDPLKDDKMIWFSSISQGFQVKLIMKL